MVLWFHFDTWKWQRPTEWESTCHLLSSLTSQLASYKICTKSQCRQLGFYTRSTFISNSISGGGQVNSDLIIPAEMDLQKTKTKCIHIEDSEMEGFDSHK